MNRCKVLKMFHLKATDTIYAPGDVIEVSDEQLAKIRAISMDMVQVLPAEEQPAEKPKRSRKKQ